MNKIQIVGLFLNLIIYLIMVFPIIIVCTRKKTYSSLKTLITNFISITILEIFLSLIIYNFGKNIFSIFTSTSGIINYATYCSKIVFITSSLYGLKFFIPGYLFSLQSKKTTILVLSKIVVTIILTFIGYFIFATKGLLFAFPISDLIYYIIYIVIFLNVI